MSTFFVGSPNHAKLLREYPFNISRTMEHAQELDPAGDRPVEDQVIAEARNREEADLYEGRMVEVVMCTIPGIPARRVSVAST